MPFGKDPIAPLQKEVYFMYVRLSIAMANYNHSQFLPERIRSILDQLSENDELVIVDDASTDNSVDIIQQFALQDTRVRLILHTENQGVVRAANRSFQESRGEYLASLSVDDRILPGFIQKTMAVLLQHPEIALCCSECSTWFEGFPDKDPNKIYTAHSMKNLKTVSIFPKETILNAFFANDWIYSHTVILRRELVLKYGGLDERLKCLSDWVLLHTIALQHGAGYIPEVLSLLRQNPSSYSQHFYSDRKHTEKIYSSLFSILCEKDKKSLRYSFSKSGLLRPYIRKKFWWLCMRPIYWNFLFFFAGNRVLNRWRRHNT